MLQWSSIRIASLVLVALSFGCSKSEPDKTPAGDADKAPPASAFASFSAADAKLAEAQGICPVSGEELDSMDAPVKVMVGDRPVFLCCADCKAKLLAEPDKYLAKLDKKK